MPCFCQFFNKNKQYRALTDKTIQSIANSESSSIVPAAGQISASEMVQLKAEVWSLRNSLSDSLAINSNMQDAVTQTVAEKYALLEELNGAKSEIALLEAHSRKERDLYCQKKDQFLQEIASYRMKINELSYLVEKLSEQNIELKKSLLDANDTIYKVSKKYVHLKRMQF
ncbi:uncharacterized protein LOC128733483 [Sabethes cyaneus]|uniref:uncharacterized protein LOC128733483 n=1 Tax=Sabethes cyaneus TaxID=53552 RepID=UPI00237D3DAA|nr:uncharacterized protein LOC128733483 [Sabethes cyaneus]